jgi:hypothetical protein
MSLEKKPSKLSKIFGEVSRGIKARDAEAMVYDFTAPPKIAQPKV